MKRLILLAMVLVSIFLVKAQTEPLSYGVQVGYTKYGDEYRSIGYIGISANKNKHIIGLGLEIEKPEEKIEYETNVYLMRFNTEFETMPVYINYRYNFLKSKFTPFVQYTLMYKYYKYTVDYGKSQPADEVKNNLFRNHLGLGLSYKIANKISFNAHASYGFDFIWLKHYSGLMASRDESYKYDTQNFNQQNYAFRIGFVYYITNK